MKIVHNKEKKGLELYFDSKPSDKIRTTLKTNGFRWSKKGFWWIKESPKAKQIIEQIKKGNSPNNYLWARTILDKEEHEIELSWKGKESAKYIRSHLKKRFKECKFSVTSDYDRIDIDLLETPYNTEDLTNPIRYTRTNRKNNRYTMAILRYCHDLMRLFNVEYQFIHTWEVKQTDSKLYIEDMKDFDRQLEKLEQEEKKKMDQYWEEQEQKKKEGERLNKLNKIAINNMSYEVKEVDPYIIKDVKYPTLNKCCRYSEYLLQKNFNISDTKITKEIHFENVESLNTFKRNLLTSFDFLQGEGGAYTNDPRLGSMLDYQHMTKEERETVKFYDIGIGIYLNNILQFISNPQGYSYSRYVGFVTDTTQHKLTPLTI